MEKGIAVISRLRKDAVGWDDPSAGRGVREKGGLSSHDHNCGGGNSAALLFASGN